MSNNKRIDGKAYKYAFCPLTYRPGNQCRFAWWYAGKCHCFFGGNDLVVSNRNVACPYVSMVRVADAVKREKATMIAALKKITEEPGCEE